MSFDDPNRESVGLAPIWTGAEEAAATSGSNKPPEARFDPGEHTVDEVHEYLEANPDDQKRVVKAEKAGKNRTTIVDA